MKLACSTAVFNSYPRFGIQKLMGVPLYSTTTTTLTSSKSSGDSLYRRISPVGDPRVSVVPLLDQWIEEGRNVNKQMLQAIIKELRHYKRFKHALEISQWMSDKRYFPLASSDIAVRLDLISRVHGIEQAENYFNHIPRKLRLEVYGTLLNCYARVKSVEKAEAVMRSMRDLGCVKAPLCYNVLLNLYFQTGNYGKLDTLMHEMEEKGIDCDKFTFSIRLNAYAATSDIEGIDKILNRMESDPNVLDWSSYASAANGYTRAGVVDKALEMLKKSEELIITAKRSRAFNYLLTQYAATGKKDEVLRLWKLYKKKEKIYNAGYISMITSLLKFDDIEGAEEIFEEWESRKLAYDFRVPTFLIGAYCRKGLMEKAEALVNKARERGEKPLAITWYYLATGYVEDNQIPKAVEAMKVAISMCQPGWKPRKDTLAACLEYFEGKGDVEGAEEFIGLLKGKGIVSTDIHDRLLNYIKDGKSNSSALNLVEGDALVGDGETPGNSEREQRDALVGDREIHGILEPEQD